MCIYIVLRERIHQVEDQVIEKLFKVVSSNLDTDVEVISLLEVNELLDILEFFNNFLCIHAF